MSKPMKFQKMENSGLEYHPSPFSISIGLLATISLFLASCGKSIEITATPGVLQSPSPTVLPETSVLPSLVPTFLSSLAPTTLPTFPDPARYDWVEVASGLELPVDIQNTGDGSGRLFVVEKRGRIIIMKDGHLLPAAFLDITGKVDSRHTEQGLLGLAFHPDYARTGLFFVNYIDLNGNTVIARFHASADDPNLADPASEMDLMHVDQPYDNHNGGGLAFGPDGYLYIGLGDGGSEGDPMGNGQNLQTLLGKILRVDVDHGEKYTIPADNPYAKGGGLPEIWAYGLRNPWRFSFDHKTGDLFIADVGQDTWEEVDMLPAATQGGMNFGWSYYEGNHPYKNQPPADANFIFPVAEYSHTEGCSITGGYVYHGAALSEWQGIYFFGDYCSGTVWGLIRSNAGNWQAKNLFSSGAQITSFGVDETGEIYLADFRSESLRKLEQK